MRLFTHMLPADLRPQIQGGRTLKVPFRAEGVVPMVQVEQQAFNFEVRKDPAAHGGC